MEYKNVAMQLENITVDQTEYNKENGNYHKFIQARNNYLSLTKPISSLEETKLLFKMLDCLDKWIVIHNKKGEKRYNAFLSNILLARKNALMTRVPKILHFVCLCEITDIQRDYINLWIQTNPDYAIRIHVDEYAVLAKELAVRIQKQASKEVLNDSRNTFPTTLFRWQNEAFSYVKKNIKTNMGDGKPSFDNCVKAYCQNRRLGSAEELEEIGYANRMGMGAAHRNLQKANPKTDIKLITSGEALVPWSSHYLTELVLRGNMVTASDILGLERLQKDGGIYLATNLLPAINEKLFYVGHQNLIQTTVQDPKGTQSVAAITSLILDELGKTDQSPNQIPARAKLIKDYPIYSIVPKKRARIEQVIKDALKKQIPLFKRLGDVKVDPFFQCSYADGNINAVAVQKFSDRQNNPFITQLLANFAKTYKIIEDYNHHGLDTTVRTLWHPIIPKITEDVQRASLHISAKAVLYYRWDIFNQYPQTSPELLGTPAYDLTYSQLLQEALDAQGDQVFPTNPYTFQKRYTPSFSAVNLLTEEVARSHLMGPMHYLKPFANAPQYGGQYIIQLYNDEISKKAAEFLYNQNRDVSDWYYYDEVKDQLVLQPATVATVNAGKYILWVGNGTSITTLHKLKIVGLLKAMLPISTSIEQLTLVVCQRSAQGTQPLSIEGLYDAFDKPDRKIKVDRIVVQENLFTVDEMGRKWQGRLSTVGANHSVVTEIDWNRATENSREVIATRSTNGLTVSYATRPLSESRVIRNEVITLVDANQTIFGLGSVIEIPIIHPAKQVTWMKDPTKLDGWIDQTTVEGILGAMEQGVVVTVAESMALIAAMGKVDHEFIINDPNLSRIAAVMQALKQSLEIKTYADWYEILDFSCGKTAFNRLVNTLFPTSRTRDQAFKRLQWRIRGKRITFFNLDLGKNDSAMAICKEMKSKTAIKAIFLGSLEALLLSNRQADKGNLPQLQWATRRLENLETNLSRLENSGQAPHSPLKRYYYSLWDPKFSLQQGQRITLKDYVNNDYIRRSQQLNWQGEPYPSLVTADNYVRKQTWKRINQETLQNNRLAPGEWVILFSTLQYNTLDEKYTISYLNTTNDKMVDITTHNSIFAEMRIYLDKNAELIKQNYRLTGKKEPIARSLGRMGGVGGFANFDDSVVSIYRFLKHAIYAGSKEEDPAMKLYTQMSVAADINNLLSLTPTLAEGAERLAPSIAQSKWLSQRFPGTVNAFLGYSEKFYQSKTIQNLGEFTTAAGFIGAGISFLPNLYLLNTTNNDRQRSLAITRMAFDSVGVLFSAVSWKLMATTEGFFPLLLVIGASYGLSRVSEKVSQILGDNIDNITTAQILGERFHQLKKGFERGGFAVVNHEVLVPLEGAVIKAIHLEEIRTPRVIFDEIGAQMRKKTDQGEDLIADSNDSAAYINLRELSGIAENQFITVANLPAAHQPALKTLILPWSPRAKINPSYAEADFVEWRNDAEFDAMRDFAAQDPHFIFEYHKSPDSFTPYFLPVLDEVEEFVGIDWMVINDLKYHYEKTDVNVYFGNHTYKVMAPGIKKDKKISESVCKNYLHYRLYGPEEGKATIFLVLNRGQADITIERSNPDITWIVNANHSYLPDMLARPTPGGYEIYDKDPDTQGEINIIAINVTQRNNTQFTFQVPLGVVTTNPTDSNRLIVREFNAKYFMFLLTPALIRQLDPDNKTKSMSPAMKESILVKRYLQQMIKDKRFFPLYIPIQNFSLTGDEKSDQVYYSVHNEDFVHTKNQPGTLFEDTRRSNVQTLFFSEEYAWFKGDLLIQEVSEGMEYLYCYRNLFWVSEIATNRLKHIYLPFCHLPDVLNSQNQAERQQIKFPSQSTINIINQPKDITRYINFEQRYRYQQPNGKQYLGIRYKIDTRYPEKGLIVTEIDNLPPEIQNQLIQNLDLNTLHHFMKLNIHAEISPLPHSKLDPSTGTGQNVKAIDNLKTDTLFSVGRRVIWPLKGSVVVKGHVDASLPDTVLNNPNEIISYAGTTTKIIDENVAVEGELQTSTKHYHFWCISDKHQNFLKLYSQQDTNPAIEMCLSDFNINNNQVLSIDNAIINTVNGLLYGLDDDRTILLAGIGQPWLLKQNNWWVYFKKHIDQLTERMEGLVSLPPGQTKPIGIAPYLTLSGLLQSDGIKPLSAWYDFASKQFILCKNEENQQITYLQMDSKSKNGAWIVKIKDNHQKEIGYITSMTIDELSVCFHKIILKNATKIPSLMTLISRISATPLSFIQVSPERGVIKGTTTDGLLLYISRKNAEFKATLLAVTPVFTTAQAKKENLSAIAPNSAIWQETYRLTLQTELNQLIQYYFYFEVIRVMLANDQQGWYHADSNKLFLPFSTDGSGNVKIHNLNKYLGYDSKNHCAYFNSQEGEQWDLIKMDQNGGLEKRIVNKGILYQRTSFLLILDSGPVSVLDEDDYINVDVPALLITTPFNQAKYESFTFQIDKFSYAMIYLAHTNPGRLRCIMPNTPKKPLISQKGWSICVIVEENLLMLFASDKNNIEFMFKGIAMPATGLSEYYDTTLDSLPPAGSPIDVSISLLVLEKYYHALYINEDKRTMDGHLTAPFPAFAA